MTFRYIGISDRRASPRVDILMDLLEAALELPGQVAECGVFQGHTTLALGLLLKARGVPKQIYALDSYEGFDDVADMEAAHLGRNHVNPLLQKGAFRRTSLELVEWKLRAAGLEGTVVPVKGYFRDTLATLPDDRYCFVHLDCDLGESYRECLAYFYPRMVPGGYICFDEYRIPAWPLTTGVIDDFFHDKPEKPVEVRRSTAGRSCSRWHVKIARPESQDKRAQLAETDVARAFSESGRGSQRIEAAT
ncbi:TylF/MycF/NovP-related O-methyltransferase [Candidatus Nitrospira bockiana]